MSGKPALRPQAAIGPALRTIAGSMLAAAREPIGDQDRTNRDAVHDFRRAMKQWRALMRLLEPFIADSVRWRREARDHARSLALARDGQSAFNAFDEMMKKGLPLSERSTATIRGRLEAICGEEERAGLTPELRDAIIVWLDAAAAAVTEWPLDDVDFGAIAHRLGEGYRDARKLVPADWSQASPGELHEFRQRVVDHRYQMDLIEPLWPRLGRMWTEEAERLRDRLGRCQDLDVLVRLAGPHQPLARWRSRLAPGCAEHTAELAQRAARIASRLFAERPKAFRRRLMALWERAAA